MDEPTGGRPRLVDPLLAQWDAGVGWLLDRLTGLDDDEYRWAPVPDAADLVDDGTGGLVAAGDDGGQPVRTIAWSLAHLSDACRKRADYTDGTASLPMAYQPFPGTAPDAVAEFAEAAGRWRAAVAAASDGELITVGHSSYPDGLDRELPFIDIVWWQNRELLHHGADIALIRDLYAASAGDGSAQLDARFLTARPQYPAQVASAVNQ